MNCRIFREQCIDSILSGAGLAESGDLAAHRRSCPSCAAYLAELAQTANAIQPSHEIHASSNFKERVMRKIAEMDRPTPAAHVARRIFAWKPALAAALAIIVAGAVLLSIVSRSGKQAYALERTIEANRLVRFIHMQFEPVPLGCASDMWAEFSDQGRLLRLRIDFPDTADGPKTTLWQEDKAEVWFKKKNSVAVVREPDFLKTIKMSVDDFDPRRIVEKVHEDSAAGRATVTIQPGRQKDEPLKLTVAYKNAPGLRRVYLVDSSTNLVTQFEKEELKGGKEELRGRVRYSEYNDPKVSAAFDLPIPADVTRIDQTNQEVGLAKGNLSDKEIAVKVAREFYEALIAQDYDKAGQIAGGLPGAFLKKQYEEAKTKFVRIVSIGEPKPHPNPQTMGLQVPCEIQVERDGKLTTATFELGVRPVYNQPDRWDVFGGI